MKTKTLAVLTYMFSILCLVAQTNVGTNLITITPSTPLPESVKDFWKYGIAVLVPIIVNIFKKIAPNIPTWLLPVSTPLLGIGLGAILKGLNLSQMGWVDMAEAGAMAVLVREAWNQIITKQMEGGSSPGSAKAILIGFGIMFSGYTQAAVTNAPAKSPAKSTAERIAAEYVDTFKVGEFQIEAAGQARTVDMENYDKSLALGGNYYVAAGAGLHAAVGFRDMNDRFIDRIEFGLIGRLPIPNLSSALLFGVGSEWQRIVEPGSRNNRVDDWAVYAEAGPLIRLGRLDVFAKVRGVRPIDGPEREHIALIAGTAITF